MKVNLDTHLTDPTGATLSIEADKPLTLCDVVLRALTQFSQRDQSIDKNSSVTIFRLASRLASGGEQNLSAEDIVLITGRLLGTSFSPYVVGQAICILEADG